jgi:hypothetical protein
LLFQPWNQARLKLVQAKNRKVQGELALTKNCCCLKPWNQARLKLVQAKNRKVQGELALSQSRTNACQNTRVKNIQSIKSAR